MKKPRSSRYRRPLCEELEPRILLSADALGVPLDPSLADGELVQDLSANHQMLDAEVGLREALSNVRRELVFVDRGVEGYERLLEDLRSASSAGRQLEVVLLDAEGNGIEQITATLEGYEELDAVLDADAAMAEGAPLVHDMYERNICVEVHQDGDHGELTVLFDVAAFDQVAEVLRPRRRRRRHLTPEQRAKLVDQLATINRRRRYQSEIAGLESLPGEGLV